MVPAPVYIPGLISICHWYLNHLLISRLAPAYLYGRIFLGPSLPFITFLEDRRLLEGPRCNNTIGLPILLSINLVHSMSKHFIWMRKLPTSFPSCLGHIWGRFHYILDVHTLHLLFTLYVQLSKLPIWVFMQSVLLGIKRFCGTRYEKT